MKRLSSFCIIAVSVLLVGCAPKESYYSAPIPRPLTGAIDSLGVCHSNAQKPAFEVINRVTGTNKKIWAGKITKAEIPIVKTSTEALSNCIANAQSRLSAVYGNARITMDTADTDAVALNMYLNSVARNRNDLKAYSEYKLTKQGLAERFSVNAEMDKELIEIWLEYGQLKQVSQQLAQARIEAQAYLTYADSYDPERETMKKEIEDLKRKTEELEIENAQQRDDLDNLGNNSFDANYHLR